MKQRVITGILFTIGVLLFIIPSFWIPFISVVFACIVGGVVIYELYNAFKKGGMSPNLPIMIIGGAFAPVHVICSYFGKLDVYQSSVLFFAMLSMICMIGSVIPAIIHKDGEGRLRDGVITLASVFYYSFSTFIISSLRGFPVK